MSLALSAPRRGPRHAVDDGASGQAMVEFALVAPIFFLLMFGIIQLGLIFAGQDGLVNGVRETTRYAAPYRVIDSSGAANTCATVQSKLTTTLRGQVLGFNSSNLVPSVKYQWKQDADYATSHTYYLTVTVKADYKFPLYVPLVSFFLDGLDGTSDGKLRLSAQEEMRVENDPLATSYSTVTC